MRFPVTDVFGMAGLFVVFLPASQAGNTISCIKQTGGSCLTSGCAAWRGSTACTKGRCTCKNDECSGSNGVCTTGEYTLVGNGTKYKLRNARWPDYYMDADLDGMVKVEKSGHDENDNKFTLLIPPYEGGQEAQTEPRFLMASVEWPNAVLTLGFTDDKYRSEVQNVDGGFSSLGFDPGMHELGMIIKLAPKKSSDGDQPVMLSPLLYPNRHLYVPTDDWVVGGHGDDPGAGGYWYFVPPLPADVKSKLAKYSGDLCSFNCGDTRNSDAANSQLSSAAGLLLALFAGLIGAALPV